MKRTRRGKLKLFGLLAALLLLLTWGTGCEEAADPNLVQIASVGPANRMEGEFQNGISMALEEINGADYVPGKTVTVEYVDDQRDLTTGIKAAQSLANRAAEISAVIGHWNAFIGIPTANVYEDARLLTITPMISSPALTRDKSYIFRGVPTDGDEAVRIADYAAAKGLTRVAVCYTDSDYGRGLANEFEAACRVAGIQVVDSHRDFINQHEFDAQYDKWVALEVDAVFISDSLPYAGELVKTIRAKDANMPILSAGGFSFDDVVALLGPEISNNITYVALYYPEAEDPSLQAFNEGYQALYGEKPASWLASKGYDLIYLIADAINAAGSKDSADLAAYLSGMEPWEGVFSTYSFSESGDPKDMELYIVEVRGGVYTYLQDL